MFKQLQLLLLLLFAETIAFGQTPYQPGTYPAGYKPAFVRYWTATAPEINSANLTLKSRREVTQSTTYYDGVGRPLQSVVKEGSLITGSVAVDWISSAIYDESGRDQYLFLPFGSTATDGTQKNGLFKMNPFQQQAAFFDPMNVKSPIAGQQEQFFYSKSIFEKSPRGRALIEFAPGDNWVGKENELDFICNTEPPVTPGGQPTIRCFAGYKAIKTKYANNTAVDEVRAWKVVDVPNGFGTYELDMTNGGVYAAGSLIKTIVTDENQKQVIEFKDRAGRVVLKKVQESGLPDYGDGRSHTGWLCTYYVYDAKGNHRGTIMPKGVKLILDANGLLSDPIIYDEQCFRFEYDEQLRVIRKKSPGAGTEFTVYDSKNRVVMVQDEKMRSGATKQWLVMLYDELNRPIQTGLWNDANTIQYHQNAANASEGDYPFSEQNLPASGYTRLIRTGYDNYNSFPSGTGLNTSFDNAYINNNQYFYTTYNTSPAYARPLVQGYQNRGKVAWTERLILGSSPAAYIYTVNIYDENGLVIQTKSNSVLQGQTVVSMQYNWEGNLIRKLEKQQLTGGTPQTNLLLTMYTLDDLGRVVQVDNKVQSTLVNNNQLPASWTPVSKTEYDAVGQIKSRSVGNKKDPGTGNYTGVALEKMDFDYNIRGWLLGMNRKYLSVQGMPGVRFGYEIGYEKSENIAGSLFLSNQFNGNIGGVIWKSDGDDVKRKYEFRYDNANRLIAADFAQENPDDHIWNNSQINYSVKMGNGVDAATAYDHNGNILAMTQYGLVPGSGSQNPVDQLTYNYMHDNKSNRLLNVIDAMNLPSTRLGDFRTSLAHVQSKTATTIDYEYDVNGNLTKDYNKDLLSYNGENGVVYNHLDLVESMTIKKDGSSNKGRIRYVYDGIGTKLQKIIEELGQSVFYNGVSYVTDIITTTTYDGDFVYSSKLYSNSTVNTGLGYSQKVLYLMNEEGRIRFARAAGQAAFHYDYFIKDNQGNVRLLLTEEVSPPAVYQATVETTNRQVEERIFTKLSETESAKPAGFDNDGANQKVSKLFNTSGSDKRLGVGLLLKVMAGDKFKALTNAWYQPGNTNNNELPGATSIITSVLDAFVGGIPAGGKIAGPEIRNMLNVPVADFFGQQNNQAGSGRPKAFLNWMVLDEEQFKLVEGNYGAVQVPEITGTMAKQLMQSSSGSEIEIKKNGYLYVFVSNESQGSVYFDDIRIEHRRGELVEETHYYPGGLPMAGISSEALLSDFVSNQFKFQSKEFEKTFDLNYSEFDARLYDPQLGRWHVPDPAGQFDGISPYAGMANNWPRYTDPDGRVLPLVAIAAIVGAVGGIINVVTHWDDIAADGFSWGKFGAAFGIGFTGGFIGTFTGGTALAAVGVSGGITGGILGGAFSGMVGSAAQSPITGIGNAIVFQDEYGPTQFTNDALMGGVMGGVGGGVITKLSCPSCNIFTGAAPKPTASAPVPPSELKPSEVKGPQTRGGSVGDGRAEPGRHGLFDASDIQTEKALSGGGVRAVGTNHLRVPGGFGDGLKAEWSFGPGPRGFAIEKIYADTDYKGWVHSPKKPTFDFATPEVKPIRVVSMKSTMQAKLNLTKHMEKLAAVDAYNKTLHVVIPKGHILTNMTQLYKQAKALGIKFVLTHY